MTRPASPSHRIAVVGAGLAGLTAARRFQTAGHEVVVFEKSRGVGGRMSTRRHGAWRFDHGAQYFTARSTAFQSAVADWEAAGHVQVWEGRLVELAGGIATPRESGYPRYVGVPGMNAPCKALADGLDVRSGTRVQAITRSDTGYRLAFEGDAPDELADRVILAIPPAQALPLAAVHPELAAQIPESVMAPCCAWMGVLTSEPDFPWSGAFVNEGPLDWIARIDSRPGRPQGAGATFVAHASAQWSETHIDHDPDAQREILYRAFTKATGLGAVATQHQDLQRWRYALARAPLEDAFLGDATRRFGLCGDWLGGARVESAWLSGMTLARDWLGDGAP